jgi:hypothetical protein
MMNIYEVDVHGTESFYLLASSKYRAPELVGDCLKDAGNTAALREANFVIHELDLSEEQILRPERCRCCVIE